METSHAGQDGFNPIKIEFKHQFITGDEIWIHYYQSKKEQSREWVGESIPKYTTTVPNARKVKLLILNATVTY